MVASMAFLPCLPQTVRTLAILSALAGLSSSCGADAPTPIKSEPDTSSSTGDDDEQDESPTDSDGDDDAPDSPQKPMDAGVKPPPAKGDAGPSTPPALDAGSRDAAV